MPRSLTAGQIAGLIAQGAYPGNLLEIEVASGHTVRLTNLDRDFDYAGNSFVSADFTVPDIGFDGTVSKGASVEFGDQTLAFWIATLYREFEDAPVTIWRAYDAVPGEAAEIFRGRFGKPARKVSRDGESISFALEAEATTLFAPRQRVQDVIDQKWLVPAGTILLVNGQKWVLDRPLTSRT